MFKLPSTTVLLAALCLIAGLALGGTLLAVRSARAQASQATAAAAAQPHSAEAGVTVFIDPATGQIRQPEAAEIGALAPRGSGPGGRREAPPAYKQFQLKNGGVGIELDRSFDAAMVVTKGDDGKLKMDCLPNQAAAEAVVQGQTEKGAQADEK